jgi:hypothetical protein
MLPVTCHQRPVDSFVFSVLFSQRYYKASVAREWLLINLDVVEIWYEMSAGSVLSGSLSPGRGASSGYGWRNGLQLWRVAANTLNMQSRTANKGRSSSLGWARC